MRPASRLDMLPTRLLSLAAAYSDRKVNEALAAMNARKWHFAVLMTLKENGPSSQAELSDHTGIFRSDLVAVVNELVDRGHVVREPDSTDRRRNAVTITKGGRTQLQKLDNVIHEVERDVFAPLTAHQRKQLTMLLAAVVEHHGRKM